MPHTGITNRQPASLQIDPIPLDPKQGFSPQDLARMYHFPENRGEGQTSKKLSTQGHRL